MTVEPLTLDFAAPSLADVIADTPGRSHRDGPATEKHAARKIKTGSAKARLLIALARTTRGLNGYEGAQRCQIKAAHIATSRMTDLEGLGFAKRDGTQRPTDSVGFYGEVFYCTEAGREVAARLEIT